MFGNNPYWDNYNGNGHGHPPYNNHDYQGYHQPQPHHNYDPMYHGGYPGQPAYGYPSTSHGLVSLEPPPPPPIPPIASSTPKKKKKAKTHTEGRQLSTLKFGGKFKKVDPTAVKATKEKFAKAVARVARTKGVNPYQWKPAQPPLVPEKRVEENIYYVNPAFQSASVVYKQQQQQRYGDETEFTAGKQRVVDKERFVELCRLFSSVIGERQRTRLKRLRRHFRARNMFEGVVAAHRVVSAGRPRGKDGDRRTFPLKSAAGGGGGGDVWDAGTQDVQQGQATSSVPDSPMMTVFASSTRLVRRPRAEVEKEKQGGGGGEKEQRNESPTAAAVRETVEGVLTSVTAEKEKEMPPPVEMDHPVSVSAASTPVVAEQDTPELTQLPVSSDCTSTPVAEEDTPAATAALSTEAVHGDDTREEEEREAARTVSPVFRDLWDEAMEGDVEVLEVKPAMVAAPAPPPPTFTPPPMKTYQQLMREKQERQLEAAREEMREQMERKAVQWAKDEMEGLHRVYRAGEAAVGMPTSMLTNDDVEKKVQEMMQPQQVITLDSSNESDGEIEVLEVVSASAARAAAEIVLGEDDGGAAAEGEGEEGGVETVAGQVADAVEPVVLSMQPVVAEAVAEPASTAETLPQPQQSLEQEWEESDFDPLLESLEQFGMAERGGEEEREKEADERDALYDRGKSWCDATLRAATTAREATAAAAAPMAPAASLPARGAYSLRVVNGTVITGDSKECYAYAEKKHCPAGMFCRFVHDGSVEHQKEQLCARLLKGLCRPGSSRCRLRHAGLQPHQLPVCQFFLRIECTETDCPLVHVKHGDHVAPCADFQKGVCMRGIHCDSPHRYVYQTVKQRGVVDDGTTTTTTGDEGEAEEEDTSTFQFFED